jgi:cytochrome c oxidase assembly factor CtaG
VRWWCSAQGAAWTWTWRPYVGVWILVAILAAVYVRIYRDGPRGQTRLDRWRPRAAALGLALIWVLLDWPVGALGAGYLESVHMEQFLGLALLVPPLLVFGLPPGWETRSPRWIRPALRLTHPLPGFLIFTVTTFVTHIPVVVDTLMVTQLGSFALDAAWLLTGTGFWWPVIRPTPPRPLGPAARLGYTFAGATAHMGVGMFLALAPFPLYRVYEIAPPMNGVDALEDQERAGGLMMFGDVVVGLTAAAVFIYLWQREEHQRLSARAGPPEATEPGPAD